MDDASVWNADWAWSLPLIVLNVIIHIIGLGFINVKVLQALTATKGHPHFVYVFALVMGVTIILATMLHAIEPGIWARAYRALGALPDNKSALLYSLSAITTYGHADLFLADHWRLMGAPGSSERHDLVWTDDGLYVRDDTADLADHPPPIPWSRHKN